MSPLSERATPHCRRLRRRRHGFSLLETQVAFALLGVALAGICPLIVMQLKMSRKIQMGFNPQTAYFHPTDTFYLVPSSDRWERKLGISASVMASAPGSSSPGDSVSLNPYVVTVVSAPARSLPNDSVTLTVQVKPNTSRPGP